MIGSMNNNEPDRRSAPSCECGSDMVRDTRPMEFQYRGHSITLEQPGWYCTACAESVMSVADALVTEPAFMDFKATVDGSLPATEVKRIRKKLKLTQQEAGRKLGGGPAAFNKYEKRREIPSKAMANLLRLLDRDPARLQELEAASQPVSGGEQPQAVGLD
ncbi:type II toxin-antitoxin system MqsA family antitoxin [Azospirillum sp. SYSU D00513]|uniref:type II toxin-antitoxin system MqsA family antitoxin n=1 Tax=Azospirillum sp. SYSU D00513 TaxID=2812561 RepID=UPI001A95ED48|nr:type II toxin-antitoxin system MqsA family antitoxin [Azospirillum sp. SYSU D00513]